ncbi:nucleoside deaminase [Nanoarchaeota archaeon]
MEEFMRLAVDEARKGMKKKEGGPFGAVIVRNGKVIAKGHNRVLKTNDPTEHAEIDTIRKASRKLKSFDLSDCELYSSCEPCPMCLGAIIWARIKTVYYGSTRDDAKRGGFADKDIYDVLEKKPKRHIVHMKQLNIRECDALFDEWNKMKGKKIY